MPRIDTKTKTVINDNIHELLEACFLHIIDSIAEEIKSGKHEAHEGEYFLCEHDDDSASGFRVIANKHHLFEEGKGVNDVRIREASYRYLALKVFGVPTIGTIATIKNYIDLNFSYQFHESAAALPVKPEGFSDMDIKLKTHIGEARVEEVTQAVVDMVEALVLKYFNDYDHIMVLEQADKYKYQDYLSKEKAGKAEKERVELERHKRVHAMSANIKAAIKSFNE